CVAGRLSGGPERADGMLHGIVTWSVSTVTMVLLFASAVGSVLGGAGALLHNALGKGGQAQTGQTAQNSVEELIRGMVPHPGALLPPTGRTEGAKCQGN